MVEKIEWAIIIGVVMLIWLGWNYIHAYDNTYDTIKTEASKNYSVVDKIAVNITVACRKWNGTSCFVLETNKWIGQHIRQKPDGVLENMFNLGNDMKNTYVNGNDCEGVATIGAGILKELNVTDVYVIMEKVGSDTHVFLGTMTGNDSMYFTNHVAGEIVWQKKLW